ncbi:MAG: sulfur carrier protein ThiS adenylyltransferase ThiF [Victivallales bacterium]|nr:sulfur carrier protein ThiS adenylyltransferase ThiF [Victivallales bacterium]
MEVNPYLSSAERAILENAKIGIAGAGGLGSNCAMHLVRSGVRHLLIADFDRVAASNLNRQFFFADQIGQKKVEALGVNLRRIVPDLELELFDQKICDNNAVELFKSCDIIVEAFDSANAKQMLIKSLLKANKKIVGASGLGGWGRSEAIRLRQFGGGKLYIIGDCASEVGNGEFHPFSPRVGVAAAMEANTVIALLLGVQA